MTIAEITNAYMLKNPVIFDGKRYDRIESIAISRADNGGHLIKVELHNVNTLTSVVTYRYRDIK